MQARSKRPYISLLTHTWLSYTSTFPSKRIINYSPDLNLTANTYRDPLICWATSTSRPATEHHSLTSIAESRAFLFIGGSCTWTADQGAVTSVQGWFAAGVRQDREFPWFAPRQKRGIVFALDLGAPGCVAYPMC